MKLDFDSHSQRHPRHFGWRKWRRWRDQRRKCNDPGLTEWFAGEAARVYELQASQQDERHLRRLRQYLERQGGAVTVRKVQTDVRPYRTKEAAERALERLVYCGYCDWTTIGAEQGVRIVGGEVGEEAA